MTAMRLHHQNTQHYRWQWTESWIVEYSTQLSDSSIICRMSCQICSVGLSPFLEPQLPWENHPTVFKVFAFLEKYGPCESNKFHRFPETSLRSFPEWWIDHGLTGTFCHNFVTSLGVFRDSPLWPLINFNKKGFLFQVLVPGIHLEHGIPKWRSQMYQSGF